MFRSSLRRGKAASARAYFVTEVAGQAPLDDRCEAPRPFAVLCLLRKTLRPRSSGGMVRIGHSRIFATDRTRGSYRSDSRAVPVPRTLKLARCRATSPHDCSSRRARFSEHSTFFFSRYNPKRDRSQGDVGGAELHDLHCPEATIEQSFAAMSLPATLWPVAFQWPKPIGVFLNPCRKT